MIRRPMSGVISYDGLSPRFYDNVHAWMANHEEARRGKEQTDLRPRGRARKSIED
jgi:hypothetical protein